VLCGIHVCLSVCCASVRLVVCNYALCLTILRS
jgi:hypothetical protein